MTYTVDEFKVIGITTDSPVTNDVGPVDDGIVNWTGGLTGSQAKRVTLQAAATGTISGDITARQIIRLDVDGDISGDITIDDTHGGDPTRIVRLDAGGDISGNIDVQRGDLGDVVAAESEHGYLVVEEE